MIDELKQIISEFRLRRKLFDEYLKSVHLHEQINTCPSCGFPTIGQRRMHDICDICDWQDDGQDDPYADEVWGGPNSTLTSNPSLTDSRIKIGKELKGLEIRLSGRIKTDTEKILQILKNRRDEMMNIGIKSDTNISDPLWEKWKIIRDSIKNDLIESHC